MLPSFHRWQLAAGHVPLLLGVLVAHQKYFFSRLTTGASLYWSFRISFRFALKTHKQHLPTAAVTLFRHTYAAAGPRARRAEHVSLEGLALLSSYRCRPKREKEKTRPANSKISRGKATDENPPRRTHQKKGKPRFFYCSSSFPGAKHTAATGARASIPCGARQSV